MKLDTLVLGFGRRRVVVVRPHPTGIGRHLLDVLHGLHISRAEGASLYLLHPKRVVTDAYYALKSEDVHVLRQSMLLGGMLRSAWTGRWAVQFGLRIVRWVARRFLGGAPQQPQPEPTSPTRQATFFGPALRRSISEHPVAVRFDLGMERDMRARVARAGVDPGKPLVTLHVREPGYESLYEMRDRPQDRDRNAAIETYFPAIDLLVAQGFQVARVGDANMTPLDRPGVIDLATSSLGHPRIDAWCIAKSRFFLCCNSGPYIAGLVTGTPTLLVNDTDVTANFAVRPGDRYLPKRVRDLDAGRVLSLAEALEPGTFLRVGADLQRADRSSYALVDNTAEEIAEVVAEMLDPSMGDAGETGEQREFRERLTELGRWLCHESGDAARWQGKFGSVPTPFFGDGRIGAGFAARHLHRSEPALADARESTS